MGLLARFSGLCGGCARYSPISVCAAVSGRVTSGIICAQASLYPLCAGPDGPPPHKGCVGIVTFHRSVLYPFTHTRAHILTITFTYTHSLTHTHALTPTITFPHTC